MNRLIATDGYHQTMGFLIEPERALELETHILYARSGGPLLVADMYNIMHELASWRPNAQEVQEAESYWRSMNVPFATVAWNQVVSITKNKTLPLTVRGVADGEVVLPGDPIAVIEAPAIMAAVIEPWLIGKMMKALQLSTRFTKLAKALNWEYKRVFEVGLRASNSVDDHNDSIRILKAAGLKMTSSGAAAVENGLVAGGSMGHRYTQRYSNDFDAFVNALDRILLYKQQNGIEGKVKLSLLLDTRSTLNSGLPAAIRLIKHYSEVISNDIDLSVRLDSGDLIEQLKCVIRTIGEELTDTSLWPAIIVESGLTASEINKLEVVARQESYPLEKMNYGVGGYLVGKTDRDFISLVYKLSSVNGLPVMKFSDDVRRGKESYPGRVTLLERDSKTRFEPKSVSPVRRLIAQICEVETLKNSGWREVFVDWIQNGKIQQSKPDQDSLLQAIRKRWQKVAQGYIGDDKYPPAVPARPQLSVLSKVLVEELRSPDKELHNKYEGRGIVGAEL